MGVSSCWSEARRGRRRRRRRSEPGRSSWLDVEASALATSVAVMAPALTEAGPQKPENLIPALPAGGFLSAEQAKQVCENREVLAQFVVSANVQPSKIDEQCLHGIPKDLINDVINLKFGSGLEGLSNLITSAPRKETRESQTSAAIMSDPSMGDPANSMCFFKTIMGPGESEETNEVVDTDGNAAKGNAQGAEDNFIILNEEKQSDEDRTLEQIMGLTSELNVQAGDIGQNVEEILQVIKSMESAVETGETISDGGRLTDSCAGIVDVVTSQTVSEVGVSEIFPDGEAFPDLLNDVDMMGLVVNDNLSDGVVIDHQNQLHLQQQQLLQRHQQLQQSSKANELLRSQAQAERRQHDLERRISFLTRRLRKLQARLVGGHVAEEATHVLELAHKSAKKCFYQDLASLGPKAGNSQNFPDLTGSLESFVQKVQKSCNALSNSVAVRQKNSCRYFGAGSRDNYVNASANRVPVFGVPQIKLDGQKLEKVAGSLHTKFRILQSAYDSDCTASSSGGESCDEMQTFNSTQQHTLPIAKRASWQYAQERASIASRWTWLQAQVADLEYKVRQHTELQRQIRMTKGLVMLEASGPSDTSSTVNGYSGVLPGSTTGRSCTFDIPSTSSATQEANNFDASRTRPFVRSLYRKRRLVQIDGLHDVSKKAARPTTIKCNCDPNLSPCAVCTGRRDSLPPQEDVELFSLQERIAMVDPGFHPVLSLPDDVKDTVHLDAIMRSTEWQQKIIRTSLRPPKQKEKEVIERRNKKAPEHRTTYPARLKKTPTTLLSAKIKRKVLKGNRTNHGVKKRMTKQQQQQSAALEDDEDASAQSGSSKYSSPVPSPLQPSASTSATTGAAAPVVAVPLPPPEKTTVKEKSFNSHSHSRLRQNSYDIDNIVIPYSVAASTRLEKLPYKEIQIPKWRICDHPPNSNVKNGAVQKSSLDSDFEDVSEEAIAQRHERSEREENKRFMNFINLPYHSRMRNNRRTDSRTDSGANTPDPMSPHPSDFGGDTMSPITSPPATPLIVNDGEHTQQPTDISHRNAPAHNAVRKRTMSLSTRSQKEESTTTNNEDEDEQVLPYEPRTFPLSDEDYDKMLAAMPGGHLQPASMSTQEEGGKVNEVEVDSQESDSTESALCDLEGEDPNDPEWTVAEARETEKDRIRPTAKR